MQGSVQLHRSRMGSAGQEEVVKPRFNFRPRRTIGAEDDPAVATFVAIAFLSQRVQTHNLNSNHWPERFTPGTTDKFVSNEALIAGSRQQVSGRCWLTRLAGSHITGVVVISPRLNIVASSKRATSFTSRPSISVPSPSSVVRAQNPELAIQDV